jgi:hypothetical protein
MASLSLPLPTRNDPHLVQTTQLEGQSYVFEFNWNSRTDRWSLSIINTDGTRILDGAILGLGVDLLRTVPDTLAYVPPGVLFVAGQDDPTLETIEDVFLIYEESE